MLGRSLRRLQVLDDLIFRGCGGMSKVLVSDEFGRM